jgi:hypothetical protein
MSPHTEVSIHERIAYNIAPRIAKKIAEMEQGRSRSPRERPVARTDHANTGDFHQERMTRITLRRKTTVLVWPKKTLPHVCR